MDIIIQYPDVYDRLSNLSLGKLDRELTKQELVDFFDSIFLISRRIVLDSNNDVNMHAFIAEITTNEMVNLLEDDVVKEYFSIIERFVYFYSDYFVHHGLMENALITFDISLSGIHCHIE